MSRFQKLPDGMAFLVVQMEGQLWWCIGIADQITMYHDYDELWAMFERARPYHRIRDTRITVEIRGARWHTGPIPESYEDAQRMDQEALPAGQEVLPPTPNQRRLTDGSDAPEAP